MKDETVIPLNNQIVRPEEDLLRERIAMLENQVHTQHNAMVDVLKHFKGATSRMRADAHLNFLTAREVDLLDNLRPAITVLAECLQGLVISQEIIRQGVDGQPE